MTGVKICGMTSPYAHGGVRRRRAGGGGHLFLDDGRESGRAPRKKDGWRGLYYSANNSGLSRYAVVRSWRPRGVLRVWFVSSAALATCRRLVNHQRCCRACRHAGVGNSDVAGSIAAMWEWGGRSDVASWKAAATFAFFVWRRRIRERTMAKAICSKENMAV
jgi:hypothetical protein